MAVDNPMIPAKVEIANLSSGETYYYRVVDNRARASSTGTFRTPTAPGLYAGLSFGVSGDQRGDLAPYPAVVNALERDLDFFVNLGDTVYADVPSPLLAVGQAETANEFRIKHQEVYGERFGLNLLGSLRASTAWLATIDDHEVTDDHSGGAHPSTDPRFVFTTESFINETPLFSAGLQVFHEYNPLRWERYGDTGDPRTAGKPRLYRYRRYGSDAALFLLDARSFRDAPIADVQDINDPDALRAFLVASFDRSRTMLGAAQLAQLQADLLEAEGDGVTWKFVMVPEPIQNLGVLVASDRFEGYAAERAEILSFIDRNRIRNVVFVAADLHGSIVNDLTYQTEAFGPQIAIDSFEVVTGPVAFDPPIGQVLIASGVAAGLISPQQKLFYDSLSLAEKDEFIESFVNLQLVVFGYSPIGLEGSTIDATLLRGRYTAGHVYGWTEFEIDATTQELTVTIYGIEPYDATDLADSDSVLERQPAIFSQFVVQPK